MPCHLMYELPACRAAHASVASPTARSACHGAADAPLQKASLFCEHRAGDECVALTPTLMEKAGHSILPFLQEVAMQIPIPDTQVKQMPYFYTTVPASREPAARAGRAGGTTPPPSRSTIKYRSSIPFLLLPNRHDCMRRGR